MDTNKIDLKTLKATAQATAEKSPTLLVTVPAGVMVELINELESNKRMLLSACMQMGAIGNALDADMNADGDELLGIVNDLQAEARELRKDAQRLDWLDGQYSPVIDGQTASDPEGEVVAYRWAVEDQSSSVRDAIDYGMAKEAK